MKCRICGNEDRNREHTAREMMIGLKEPFSYFQCGGCDCLQIADFPDDMSRFYPATYYSYARPDRAGAIKSVLLKWRDRYALFGQGWIGKKLSRKFPREQLEWLKRLKLTRKSRILDIGCGTGALLYSLRQQGCEQVLGADPFVDKDLEYANGLRILKRDIHGVEGTWDLVMFHHSFEHMADPERVLQRTRQLLDPHGVCLIAVPVVPCYAWEHYGTDWVQLDAPRHFFLHSVKSMEILADRCGLMVSEVLYNSSAFQFWGSEQYRRQIPLRSPQSYAENPAGSIFSDQAIQEFSNRAQDLNKDGRGDSAVFFLRPQSAQAAA
ncbi:MAG: class I SAM-dependent methyltransferase [Planctomycetaceae bacterium]